MSLEELTKEQLEELVRIYARNLLALDGVWFQSVERGRGMDEAMAHDCAVPASLSVDSPTTSNPLS